MASAADQPDVMADWAGGRRCAVCRARIGVRNSRSCNRCWRLVCNSGPCWVWGLCTPCRSDNHGVTSVEGQEEKDKACETRTSTTLLSNKIHWDALGRPQSSAPGVKESWTTGACSSVARASSYTALATACQSCATPATRPQTRIRRELEMSCACLVSDASQLATHDIPPAFSLPAR